MYYDADVFKSQIEQYRKEVSYLIKNEKALLNFYLMEIKEISERSAKSLTPNDFYNINKYGVTNFDLMISLSQSFLITIYGRFEYHLNVLCEVVKSALGLGISYSDMNGSNLDKAVKYLEKSVGIDIREKNSSNQSDYESIICWSRLRNIIAHNYGVPHENDFKKLEKIGIHCNGEVENVVTDMKDCERLINAFERFFDVIFDKLLAAAEEQ